MFKRSRLRSPFILSLLMAAVTIFGTFGVFGHHRWGRYHWARTTSQFTLKLGNNLTTTDWSQHLSASSSDWNSPETFLWNGAQPLLTSIVNGQGGNNCTMVSGTTQVCNGAYGQNGWLGLATINITSGSHITKGSAQMNDTYFSNTYNGGYYNTTNERRHVMCQEIAHTFGLDHQSENGRSLNTCMDYFSNTGGNTNNPASTKPNYHDFEQLASIYQHLDSTTTVAANTAAAASASGNAHDSNNWGQLISQSANGRSSTYERAHSDGSLTLTHVFWTEEAAAHCHSCDHRFDH
jgi:hypothetical protein